jgi:general secretion pathway protein L
MPSRQSREEMQDVQGTFAGIDRGWRAELAQLRQELRGWFVSNEPPLPTVLFEDAAIVAHLGADLPPTRIARDGLLSPTQISGTLSRLIGSQTTARDIVLAFPESQIWRVRLSLPNGQSRMLRKAIRYEIERLSPIDANEVYFDFAKSAAATATGMREIEARVIHRDVVDVAVATCVAANLRVGAIEFAGDGRRADWRSLPVDHRAFARRLWRRWNVAILASATMLLALMLVFAAYARGNAQREAAMSAVAQERERAATVEHLQQQIRATASAGEFVNRQKNAPMLASILAEVSRILPDNTWVTQMTLSDGKLRLEGYSRASSDLIVLFDRSPHFANAQFVAPQTRDEQTKVEHFDLSLDIRSSAR